MALSANRQTDRREGILISRSVYQAVTIYRGGMVNLNSTGYAIPAADTAGTVFDGVAYEKAANATGATGAKYVRVWRTGLHTLDIAAATVADIGKPVWVSDDQTVTLVKGNVFCGILAEVVSATSVRVDIGPAIGDRAIRTILSIPVKLSKVADGDVVTTYTPGFAGTITKISFAVTDPATTAAKLTTLNLEIGTTNVTGGAVALTSANCTPLGKVTDGTAITAGNRFTAADTISVEAASTTAFVEGEGVLLIVIA